MDDVRGDADVLARCRGCTAWPRTHLKRWRGERRHLRALARASNEWRDVQNGVEDADERVAAQALGGRLLDAVASLPERDRDVLVLVAWEELSYEEIAAALDIPVGTSGPASTAPGGGSANS